MENCPECGAAFDKVLEERGGPTTYWKCWSYQRRNGRHFASAICDMRSLENQVDSLTAQLAALTQRAEQLKRERDIYRRSAKWSGELFCWCLENLDDFVQLEGDANDEIKRRLKRLVAAEAEVKRLGGLEDQIRRELGLSGRLLDFTGYQLKHAGFFGRGALHIRAVVDFIKKEPTDA